MIKVADTIQRALAEGRSTAGGRGDDGPAVVQLGVRVAGPDAGRGHAAGGERPIDRPVRQPSLLGQHVGELLPGHQPRPPERPGPGSRRRVEEGDADAILVTGSFHTVGEALVALGLAGPEEPYTPAGASASDPVTGAHRSVEAAGVPGGFA